MFRITATELPRFMICNGSRLLAGEIPPEERDQTPQAEGIAAHWVAAMVFNGQSSIDELIDRKAPNGVYITEEIADHVSDYCDVIRDQSVLRGVEIDTTHSGSNWIVPGRVDYISLSADGQIVRVVDFKFGWRIVEPERNWTLISHAVSFIRANNLNPSRVDFQIFQPRPQHRDGKLRTWSVSFNEFISLENDLTFSLSNPVDHLQTSNYCGECFGIANCPAARKAELNAIDMCDSTFSEVVENDQLAFMLRNIDRAEHILKARKNALEELATHRLKNGQVIENYSVEMGLGNTRWKEGIDASILFAITGKDLSAKKLVTPAEAKRRGVGEIVVNALTERPSTGLKLVRENTNKKATRMFNKQG